MSKKLAMQIFKELKIFCRISRLAVFVKAILSIFITII
jgi:hypothetical protein